MADITMKSDDYERYITYFYIDFNILGLPEGRINLYTTEERTTYGKKLLDVCKNNSVLIYNGRTGG